MTGGTLVAGFEDPAPWMVSGGITSVVVVTVVMTLVVGGSCILVSSPADGA